MNDLATIGRSISELRRTLRTLEALRNELLDRQGRAEQRDPDKPVTMAGPDGKIWKF